MPKGGIRPQAQCHPQEPHYAKGLCQTCYARSRTDLIGRKNRYGPIPKLSTCHAERPHCARGLCRKCYAAKWAREHYVKAKRTKNIQKAALKYLYKKEYGITLDTYDKLYIMQKGCCAICKTKLPSLSVDHNHITKEVRGLLCKYCNWGLGHFKDNPQILEAAIKYLNKEVN